MGRECWAVQVRVVGNIGSQALYGKSNLDQFYDENE